MAAHLGDIVHTESREVVQLEHPGGAGGCSFQLSQRLIESQDFEQMTERLHCGLLRGDMLDALPALDCTARPRMVDKDLPHQECSEGKKVRTLLQRRK